MKIVQESYRINSYKILFECYNLVRFYKNYIVRIGDFTILVRYLSDLARVIFDFLTWVRSFSIYISKNSLIVDLSSVTMLHTLSSISTIWSSSSITQGYLRKYKVQISRVMLVQSTMMLSFAKRQWQLESYIGVRNSIPTPPQSESEYNTE